MSCIFFFFIDTATTEIYTLSLHDALPIWPPPALRPGDAGDPGRSPPRPEEGRVVRAAVRGRLPRPPRHEERPGRSEEHTSELQSRLHLVCRLLLEKKNTPLAPYVSYPSQA